MKRRLLVDLNVVLDVLLPREPHLEVSSRLWAAIESGQAEGFLAAHSVTTLHYLAKRAKDGPFADQCVRDVLQVFRVAAVDDGVVNEALAMRWADFEDAVAAASARAAGCHALATRDPRGFRRSPCPALTPVEALALLQASSGTG